MPTGCTHSRLVLTKQYSDGEMEQGVYEQGQIDLFWSQPRNHYYKYMSRVPADVISLGPDAVAQVINFLAEEDRLENLRPVKKKK